MNTWTLTKFITFIMNSVIEFLVFYTCLIVFIILFIVAIKKTIALYFNYKIKIVKINNANSLSLFTFYKFYELFYTKTFSNNKNLKFNALKLILNFHSLLILFSSKNDKKFLSKFLNIFLIFNKNININSSFEYCILKQLVNSKEYFRIKTIYINN